MERTNAASDTQREIAYQRTEQKFLWWVSMSCATIVIFIVTTKIALIMDSYHWERLRNVSLVLSFCGLSGAITSFFAMAFNLGRLLAKIFQWQP